MAGDFYDAFMLGPATMGFVVADVADKGVGAALFMALVRSLVRVYTQQRYSVLAAEAAGASASSVTKESSLPAAGSTTGIALQQAIILANDYIGDNHLSMNMFATMFAGVLHLETGAIVYVNARAQRTVLVTTTGSTVRLPSKSPAVGMVPGYQFPIARRASTPAICLWSFPTGFPTRAIRTENSLRKRGCCGSSKTRATIPPKRSPPRSRKLSPRTLPLRPSSTTSR